MHTQNSDILEELNAQLIQAISRLCQCSFAKDNFRLRSLSCPELTSLKIHANVTKPADYDGSVHQLLKDISIESDVLQLPSFTLTPGANGERVELSFVSISDGTPGGITSTDLPPADVDVTPGETELTPGDVNVGGVQSTHSAALTVTGSVVATSLTVLASVVFV